MTARPAAAGASRFHLELPAPVSWSRLTSAATIIKMNNEVRFAAPWCLTVKIITVAVVALLLGVSIVGSQHLPDSTPLFARLSATLLPLAILAGTLPFIVRGYVISDGELRIERLGWQNRFALAEVVTVSADPKELRRSIRLCGSGGLFGFFGWFWNRPLGIYRAYGTDPQNAVVIKLKDRTIVVTPDAPQRFVAEVAARRLRSG